jgi:hypothetical protein
MTAAQFELLGADEAESILGWRFEVLVRAGCSGADAMIVASQVEVDLHAAAALLARGCPAETALRILL